jgi:periplasmic divalent cation tolerance protein
MVESTNIVVYVTSGKMQEAEKIAEALLSKKKAACVNIIPGVESRYWWHGKLESAKEYLLVIKTRMSKLDDVIEEVKKVHSYTVPEIIAMPIVGGNAEYLKWIGDEVKK